MVVYLPVDSCDLLENLYLCKVKHIWIRVMCLYPDVYTNRQNQKNTIRDL